MYFACVASDVCKGDVVNCKNLNRTNGKTEVRKKCTAGSLRGVKVAMGKTTGMI